jgi:DNA-binding transcriptional regulator YdaS (Cro superfamily)
MSTTTKKKSTKGIRYTDAQKKEVIDFAVSYNAANGRGGQSKAAAKFGVSQLTVAGWLKSSGTPKAAKAPAAAKAPKAPKAAKAPKKAKAGKSKAGTRYTDEQKKEVVDFAVGYNEANGRGGQSKAAAKFKISPLTVVAWLKAAGVKGGAKKSTAKVAKAVKAPKAAKTATAPVSGSFDAKLTSLLAMSKEITKAEAELAKLVSKFNAAKASL